MSGTRQNTNETLNITQIEMYTEYMSGTRQNTRYKCTQNHMSGTRQNTNETLNITQIEMYTESHVRYQTKH